jgi:hypothetical protein
MYNQETPICVFPYDDMNVKTQVKVTHQAAPPEDRRGCGRKGKQVPMAAGSR